MKVFRTYALEPAFELSANRAASAPVRTVAFCTAAVPPPLVCTWLQAEKSPDSNPSLKTVFVAAAVVNFTVSLVHEIVPTLSPRPPICSS